ncbi:MAG: molybdopterin-dependent oxidoreductase [Pseudomonadota bacterium]
MKTHISRRTFLRASSLGFLSLSLTGNEVHAFTGVSDTAYPVQPAQTVVPTICAMCRARCHVQATVVEGRVKKLEGNPQSPLNERAICARGQAAVQLLYDPDRLKYPLQRVGERGEGKWKRISWQQAFSAIVFQMKKNLTAYGPDSIALFAGGPSSFYIKKLFMENGITRIHDAAVSHCDAIRNKAYDATFGFFPGDPPRHDYSRSKCIVLLGSHLGENIQVPELRQVLSSRERGTELIVVDPRFSSIAAKSSHYLSVKPGTDTALLLGWMHHIVFQELYDKAWVDLNCRGFDELKEHLRSYPVNRVSDITGIDGADIIRTAELMAANAPAVIVHPGSHLSWYGNDVQRVRAQTLLAALLGAVGRPGSLQLPSASPLPDSLAQFSRVKGEGTASFSSMMNEVLENKVKVVGCWGQNPLQNHSSPFKTVEAFKRADFVFCCDVLPGETSLYADIILPEASFLERFDVLETAMINETPLVASAFPAVQPQFETREPYWIVKSMAEQLELKHSFSHIDGKSFLDGQLAGVNLTLDGLAGAGGLKELGRQPMPAQVVAHNEGIGTDTANPPESPPALFPTADGKVALYALDFAGKGWDPMPVFQEPAQPPSGFLRLLYGRSPVHTLTSTINNAWLTHETMENELWLNNVVAGRLGIADGDGIFLENQDGIRSVKPIHVKVTEGIRPDCVYMVHGYGCRSSHLEIAFNRGVSDTSLMTRSIEDPVSGTRGMRVNFVRLLPLKA